MEHVLEVINKTKNNNGRAEGPKNLDKAPPASIFFFSRKFHGKKRMPKFFLVFFPTNTLKN